MKIRAVAGEYESTAGPSSYWRPRFFLSRDERAPWSGTPKRASCEARLARGNPAWPLGIPKRGPRTGLVRGDAR